ENEGGPPRYVPDRARSDAPRAVLGRGQRPAAPCRLRHPGEIPDRLLRRVEEPAQRELLEDVQERLQAVRRAEARLLRRRLQGGGRQLLGAAELAGARA